MTLTSKQAAFIRRMTESAENEQWGYELLLKRANFAEFFDELKHAGMFEAARNSGPVPGTQPNSLRIPYWPALDYLLACAKLSGSSGDLGFAEKVLSVVRVVSASRDVPGEPPDNYHTHRVFAEIVGAVPLPAIKDEDLDLVPVWLSSRFDTGLVTRALDSGLLRRLLESNSRRDASRACRVLRHCTAIRWVVDTKLREDAKTPVTAAEDYWLDELLQHHANSFGSKAGREASELLLDRVREVFGGASHPGMSWLIRPAVEAHEQNHRWEGAANTLVDGARDVLLAWVAQDPAGAQPFVSGLLSDGSDMVRRIALYVSNQRWDALAHAFIERISPELFDIRHIHELYGLLRDRFSMFDPADRSRTTDAIRNIPVPTTGEDPERQLKYTQKRWLSAIAGKGDPSADAWFAELSADGALGLSEHPDFLSFIETRWGPGPSAYRPEELAAFARDGTLVDRLNAFRDTGAWRAPTTSALVDALESAVALEPQTFAEALPTFRKAKRPYQYGIINGFKGAWDSAKDGGAPWDTIWRALLDFSELLLRDPSFWTEAVPTSRDLTPTRDWIPSLIADFIRAGTREEAKSAPEGLFPRCIELLHLLLEKAAAATSPDGDPMDKAINSPKGRTIEAVFSLLLRMCRSDDKASGHHEGAWEVFRPAFDTELAKCKNANFEFSTLLGAYFAQLDYVDSGWLRSNIGAIFPEDYATNFYCAAGGLAYASPTRPTYQLLRDSTTLDRILRAPNLPERSREQIIERVGLAYLWGDESLDSPRFEFLFRGDGIADLKALSEFFWGIRNEVLEPNQIDRILAFWHRCLAIPMPPADEAHRTLFSGLGLLAAHVRVVDERAARLLLAVAPFVHLNHHGDLFIAELDRLAEQAPPVISEVLETVLREFAPQYDFDDHLKSTISKLAAHGQRERAMVLTDKVRYLAGMRELYAQFSDSQ